MKKVQLNNVSEGVRYPLTTLFAQHIQEAYTEIVDALVKGLIEDPSELTILHGCTIGGASPNFTVSAGAAYYQGEVFLVDAGTVNVPSGQTLVWRIEESYAAGDPVTFSDNIPRNAHLIRKMKLVAGASGSGVADNGEVRKMLKENSLNDILVRIDNLTTIEWKDFPFYEGAGGTLQYSKDIFGNVRFRGGVSNLHPSWVIVGYLPEGYRPPYLINFPTFMRKGGSLEFGRASLLADGTLTLRLATGEGPNATGTDAQLGHIIFNVK